MAVIECSIPDGYDTVRYRDAGQLARSERIISNVRNGVGNHDAGQMATIIKRIVSDGDDAVWDRDAGQARATTETKVFDFIKARWN